MGLCEKALPSNCYVAPNDNFLIDFKFIPSSPHSPPPTPPPPSNVVAPKNTNFHPFCSKFNFVLGGRGGVTSFTIITGKVPRLLTSIVEPNCVPQLFLGSLLRTGASNSLRSLYQSKLAPVFFSLVKWRIPANCSYYEHRVCALRGESP